MNLLFRSLCVAALGAGCAFSAYAEDMDMNALRTAVERQEARMADMEAKIGSLQEPGEDGPENITSLRKNAKVTIGGLVSTRYTYSQAKVDSNRDHDDPPQLRPTQRYATAKNGNLAVNDAELEVQIEVNDHFDAYLNIDMHSGADESYGNAKAYWIRWKNICNSGFGLKIGRDALVFGEEGYGELASYAAGGGDGISELDLGFDEGIIPAHNGWDMDGVTQITPYWEGLDGNLTFELSFMQNVDNDGPGSGTGSRTSSRNGYDKYHSRNYGLGSASARITYTPFEGLKLTASALNFYSSGSKFTDDIDWSQPGAWALSDEAHWAHKKNNSAVGLAFSYRPCFFSRLNVWGQWVHGWNAGNLAYESDAFNFGASFDITENLTAFAQGDVLNSNYRNARIGKDHGSAWAFYAGVMYSMPIEGLSLEAGWKHEKVKRMMADYAGGSGDYNYRAKADTVYAHLGFEF